MIEIELKEIFHKMKLSTTAKSCLLNNFQKKSNAYFINNTIILFIITFSLFIRLLQHDKNFNISLLPYRP